MAVSWNVASYSPVETDRLTEEPAASTISAMETTPSPHSSWSMSSMRINGCLFNDAVTTAVVSQRRKTWQDSWRWMVLRARTYSLLFVAAWDRPG